MLALLAPLLLAGAPASVGIGPQAQDKDEMTYVAGAWADPAQCNLANAMRSTLDEVVRSAAALKGRCVAIEGFWSGNGLFAHERDANRQWASMDASLEGRKIGIYAHKSLYRRAPAARHAVRYTMVGLVGQCETQWPDAVMVTGYCHSSGGPILIVAEAHRSKR